jgi:hypothetical protein
MMEVPFLKLNVIISCILITIIICSGYTAVTKGEGFAIYLTKDDIPPNKMEALSHVELADLPILSVEDVITYNAKTHEMKLTSSAFERISKLNVPVIGRSFMVCVNKEPIYWGVFWTPISSISFNGVTIWKPYSTQGQKIIVLALGYPSSSFYGGEDPRNNARVLDSLEKAGKLITRLSLTAVDKLPDSMKGYELYSWEENGQWHYTLITGTNRVKTMEEITSEEDFISETGWVNIHVVGLDAIKGVLVKFPKGESVFWGGKLHTGETTGRINLRLPPKQIVDVVSGYAKQCGLNFISTAN